MGTKPHKPLPSQEQILEYLSYDPDTGIVSRIKMDIHKRAKLGPVGWKNGEHLTIKCCGGSYMAHRLIWRMVTEEDPGELEIDHRDGVGDNNRWLNLRKATLFEQRINSKLFDVNDSGVKGVKLMSSGRWSAKITANKKVHRLGTFDTREEAVAARLNAELRLHGDFARQGLHN